MNPGETGPDLLKTSAGDFRLREYRLPGEGREWKVRHLGVVMTEEDETRAIVRKTNRIPYGASLWPSGIALARATASRAERFAGRRVLELGAGTGLPGIVAASLGASVVQTDHDELVLDLARRNAEANGLSIEHRRDDWASWNDPDRYDWILGADVLYVDSLRPPLRRIFESNLAPRGRVLLADPHRPGALDFLESLKADGWLVSRQEARVADGATSRAVGVFELVPPGPGASAASPPD